MLGILDVTAGTTWSTSSPARSGCCWPAPTRARVVYALGLGAVYRWWRCFGFLAGDGDEIFKLIPVNTEDNFLHLLIGLAGVGGGLATPGTAPPSTQRPAVA